jgi:hypothetical protein
MNGEPPLTPFNPATNLALPATPNQQRAANQQKGRKENGGQFG